MSGGAWVESSLTRLQRRKEIVKSDLLMKVEISDWHGVADAAMDLREIEAEQVLIGRIEAWEGWTQCRSA